MKIRRARNIKFNSSVRKANEYIVWKNRKGKVLKRVDSRQYVIGEIRRKSKRGIFVIGYTNHRDKKSKGPSPQRYTATQRAIRQSHRKLVLSSQRRIGRGAFIVRSGQPIYPQVPAWAVTEINREVRINGEALWSVKVDHSKLGKNLVPEFSYQDRILGIDQGRMIIAIRIKEALDSAQLRMSPKLKTDAEGKKRTSIRKVTCRIVFRGFDL